MSVSDAGGCHPVQRLRFNPSNIQENLKRAEGGILLFFLKSVFCMPSMGGVSS